MHDDSDEGASRDGASPLSGPPAGQDGWSPHQLEQLRTLADSATRPRWAAEFGALVEPPVTDDPRYDWLEPIAGGGQGDIWRVFDRRLDRQLAIKVLRPGASERACAAMRLECAITVSLSHPGIVPVFDRGETDDGRPWFAMKVVEGEALAAIFERVHKGPPGGGGARWTTRRLIDLLGRICDAVAYAHQRGVVHGDLKPANIMVGPFGEALVMDWGLARRIGDPAPTTGSGRPAGTAGYLPPERYRDPRRLSPATDIYALGAILYRILTTRRLPLADGALADDPWPAGLGASQIRAPAELVDLCRAAMHPDPRRRLEGAGELGAALVGWLDGARQREQALKLVAEARVIRKHIETVRGEIADLERRARIALEGVRPSDPVTYKRDGWRLADAARFKAEALALEELSFEQTLRAALTRVPDLPEANAALAEHYRVALIRAEARRDTPAARRYAELLRTYDDGRHARWLAGDGALTLICDPIDTWVTLFRYAERDRRLQPVDPQALGQGPIFRREMPRGSYLAVLEAPGHEAVRYPIHIGRGEHWHGRPPGSDRARPIRLPRAGAIGPDEIYVPAGWTRIGGDPEAPDPLDARRLWVDGFIIGRTSVTHRAWLACMQRLLDDGFEDAAGALMPRSRGARGAGLYLREGSTWIPGVTEDDDPIRLDGPVVLVDWYQADRFADLESERTGLPWRLPHDVEWEKAARGVDGRHLPWGDHFDPSRAVVLESFADRPRPTAVAAADDDESPYGVRDTVGCIRNWCASGYAQAGPEGDRLLLEDGEGQFRAVRGGHWASKSVHCRPAGRFANRPEQRFRVIGVRLVRSFG